MVFCPLIAISIRNYFPGFILIDQLHWNHLFCIMHICREAYLFCAATKLNCSWSNVVHKSCAINSPWWRIYASVHWVSIGWGDNLSPVRCQSITWANIELVSIIRSLRTYFSEIRTKINFSFIKMHINFFVKWRPCRPGRDRGKLYTACSKSKLKIC